MDATPHMKRVNLTLPQELLDEIDAAAAADGTMSRSAWLRAAAVQRLAVQKRLTAEAMRRLSVLDDKGVKW